MIFMKRKGHTKNRKPVGDNKAGNFQCFAEPLEVHHFPFPQEPQGSQNVRVFRQVDEVFIGAAGFLLCCTFGSVM